MIQIQNFPCVPTVLFAEALFELTFSIYSVRGFISGYQGLRCTVQLDVLLGKRAHRAEVLGRLVGCRVRGELFVHGKWEGFLGVEDMTLSSCRVL